MKSKLMEEPMLLLKLISLTLFSKKKSELIQFSNKMKCLMFWELPEVRDSKVLSKDGELNIYKRNPTEVTEKSVVLEHGTQLEFLGLYPELVNSVITIELK